MLASLCVFVAALSLDSMGPSDSLVETMPFYMMSKIDSNEFWIAEAQEVANRERAAVERVLAAMPSDWNTKVRQSGAGAHQSVTSDGSRVSIYLVPDPDELKAWLMKSPAHVDGHRFGLNEKGEPTGASWAAEELYEIGSGDDTWLTALAPRPVFVRLSDATNRPVNVTGVCFQPDPPRTTPWKFQGSPRPKAPKLLATCRVEQVMPYAWMWKLDHGTKLDGKYDWAFPIASANGRAREQSSDARFAERVWPEMNLVRTPLIDVHGVGRIPVVLPVPYPRHKGMPDFERSQERELAFATQMVVLTPGMLESAKGVVVRRRDKTWMREQEDIVLDGDTRDRENVEAVYVWRRATSARLVQAIAELCGLEWTAEKHRELVREVESIRQVRGAK